VEQLSSHLWTTHQQDAFRKAATDYFDRLARAIPAVEPKFREWALRLLGRELAASEYPLFSKIAAARGFHIPRSIPRMFGCVTGNLQRNAQRRIRCHTPTGISTAVKKLPMIRRSTSVSYAALEPGSQLLLAKVQKQSDSPGMGPRILRTAMAALRPSDLQLDKWLIQCCRGLI